MTLLKAFLLGCSNDAVWFLPAVLLVLLTRSQKFSFRNSYFSPQYIYVYLIVSICLFPIVFLCKPLLVTNYLGIFYFLCFLFICIVFELTQIVCSYTKIKSLMLEDFALFLILVGSTVYEFSIFQGTFFQDFFFLIGTLVICILEMIIVLSIFRIVEKRYCHPALKSPVFLLFIAGLLGGIINFLSEHSLS